MLIPQEKLPALIAAELKLHGVTDFKAPIVVYLEDIVYNDGFYTAVPGKLDQWDDLSLIFQNGRIIFSALATTEPGAPYTHSPMNSEGAFRIAFGVTDGWIFGYHKRESEGTSHPCLIPTETILGHRDFNKDGRRTGDKISPGYGIHQHGAKTSPHRVGRYSAGCLVRANWQSHLKFIHMLRSSGYNTFQTAVLSADHLVSTLKLMEAA